MVCKYKTNDIVVCTNNSWLHKKYAIFPPNKHLTIGKKYKILDREGLVNTDLIVIKNDDGKTIREHMERFTLLNDYRFNKIIKINEQFRNK